VGGFGRASLPAITWPRWPADVPGLFSLEGTDTKPTTV
jgi:hypothetical protein